MFRFLLLIFALSVTGLLTVAPVQAAGACQIIPSGFDPGTQSADKFYSSSHALVIGMDKYTSGWRPLNNAVADARAD